MGAQFAQWTLDAQDMERMAGFWAAALGYRIDRSEDGSLHLWPDEPDEPGIRSRLTFTDTRTL